MLHKELPAAISCGEELQSTLFPAGRCSRTRTSAARVFRKVAKLSPEAADLLRRGFLTCLPEKELHLYRLVVKLLEEGPAVPPGPVRRDAPTRSCGRCGT